MPVYNCEKTIKMAVDSILNQTLHDFELIIGYDKSTDNTLEILDSYHDARIIVIINNNKSTIVNSLNRCLKIANGKYIARMDGDDICHPNRFEVQYNFVFLLL